jgi:hypothetical protein
VFGLGTFVGAALVDETCVLGAEVAEVFVSEVQNQVWWGEGECKWAGGWVDGSQVERDVAGML